MFNTLAATSAWPSKTRRRACCIHNQLRQQQCQTVQQAHLSHFPRRAVKVASRFMSVCTWRLPSGWRSLIGLVPGVGTGPPQSSQAPNRETNNTICLLVELVSECTRNPLVCSSAVAANPPVKTWLPSGLRKSDRSQAAVKKKSSSIRINLSLNPTRTHIVTQQKDTSQCAHTDGVRVHMCLFWHCYCWSLNEPRRCNTPSMQAFYHRAPGMLATFA